MDYKVNRHFYDINEISELIKDAPETFITDYERQFDAELKAVASEITDTDAKILFISGPSCSGKTTSSHRISAHLAKAGYETTVISLDDFYFCRDDMPDLENGDKDYESISAIDTSYFADRFDSLLSGKETAMPLFDFISGERTDASYSITAKENTVFIVEGLHALAPEVVRNISCHYLTLYISTHSGFEKGSEPVLTRNDVRLLRRLVRDNRDRGAVANLTFKLWKNVRYGENRFIVPSSIFAKKRINTTLPYDVAFLKNDAISLLDTVTDPAYKEKAAELKSALDLFPSLDKSLLPDNSVLREFVGK